jgi:hypothetical protein
MHFPALACLHQVSGSYVEENAGYKTVDTFAGKVRAELLFKGLNESPALSLRRLISEFLRSLRARVSTQSFDATPERSTA